MLDRLPWRIWLLVLIVPLVLTPILVGCGTTVTDSPGGARPARPTSTQVSLGQGSGQGSGQASESDHAVPPVVLRDPAPGTLDISMALTFDQPSGDSQPMTEVGLAFLAGDHTVQFAGNERVACDGATLSLKDRVAVFQVLREPTAQAVGTTVQCSYAADGATASVALQIPQAPAIILPQNDAQVTRSTKTVVTYLYDPATEAMLGIVALAPSSPMPKAIATLNTPGPLQATVDTSRFLPVTGSLVLTLSLTPHITKTGIAFHSVYAFGTATAQVTVTWM